jgi:hypothetical protein
MRKRDGHFVNFCTLTPFSDPIFPGLEVAFQSNQCLCQRDLTSSR